MSRFDSMEFEEIPFAIFKLKHREIALLFENCFDLFEIRQRLGKSKGLIFDIHSAEQNHPFYHLHISYDSKQIVVKLPNCEFIAGDKQLYSVKRKVVIDWVNNNFDLIESFKDKSIIKQKVTNVASRFD